MNPGPVCRLSREGVVLLANSKAKRVFGESNLLGRCWLELCPGLTPALWESICEADDTYAIEAKIGETWMLFTHVNPENRHYIFVYGMDITANKLNERKLEEQAAVIAEIARFPDMNPGPVLRMTLQGEILLANRKAESVFGDELLHKNWLEILPGIAGADWNRIVATEDVVPFETRVGEVDWVFNHRMDEKTNLIFTYGTDITLNKQNEKKLAEQGAIIREIARFPDMNPGPVLRMDLDGSILLSNAAATNVFGENLQGRNWKETLPGLTEESWRVILNSPNVVPIESRVGEQEFVFHHRRDFQTNLVFTYGTDITLQKLAERSLRQSEKMATLGTLAAGVAHELNNPAAATKRAADHLRQAIDRLEKAHVTLDPGRWNDRERELLESAAARVATSAAQPNTMDALVRSDREADLEEWLDERSFDDAWQLAPSLVASGFDRGSLTELAVELTAETIQSALPWLASLYPVYSLLHEISEGSGRISEIVVALKNYSYLGQAPVQAVNIHEGIDNTLVILRNKLKRGITVHREYSDDLPQVMAYGSELNQVWTNLIDNAADAMQGEGTITIRTRKDAEWAVIEIEDSGPGMPKDIQSRIFDPFFPTKAPGNGTGLGLSTSYGIITEKHRGEILLASRPGRPVFTVTIPLTPPPTSASA
jgi:signal transduction histidine kinase